MTEDSLSVPVQKPEPSGIGGWLLLPALGLIVTPFRTLADAFTSFKPVLNSALWGFASPAMKSFVVGEIIVNIVLLISSIWLAVLFFQKRKGVPKLFVGWLLLNLAVQLADLIIASLIFPNHAQTPEDFKGLLRNLGALAIWWPYFWISVRVKNTFVE